MSQPQSHLVLLIQGLLEDGESYWAYLRIAAVRAKAFEQAQRAGALQLEEFGDVIEWGSGERVPPEVMERMERLHHVNHQFERDARLKS